jgi:hypothetical protein
MATPRKWVEAKATVERMSCWFDKVNDLKKLKNDSRTLNERVFDSGVFTAAELIRRITGDEELALAVHEACIWRQREHKEGRAREHSDTGSGAAETR